MRAGVLRDNRTHFPEMLVAMGKILGSLPWLGTTIHRESELLQKAKPWPFGTDQSLNKDERDFLE